MFHPVNGYVLTQSLKNRGIYSLALELKDGLKPGLVWHRPIIAVIDTGESPFHYTTLIATPDGNWNYIEDFSFFVSQAHTNPKAYRYLLLTSGEFISNEDAITALKSQNSTMMSANVWLVTCSLALAATVLLVINSKQSASIPTRGLSNKGEML